MKEKTENNVKINTLECRQKCTKKFSYKYKGSIIFEISQCFNFFLLLRKTQQEFKLRHTTLRKEMNLW